MAQLVGPAHNISRLHSECPDIRCPLAGSLCHRHTYTCHSCPPCQVRLTEKERGPGLGSLWALGKGWCGYLPSSLLSPHSAQLPTPLFPESQQTFPQSLMGQYLEQGLGESVQEELELQGWGEAGGAAQGHLPAGWNLLGGREGDKRVPAREPGVLTR